MGKAGDAAGSSGGEEEPLDVKPLRSLSPMFPPSFGYSPSVSPPRAPPFVFISPFSPQPPTRRRRQAPTVPDPAGEAEAQAKKKKISKDEPAALPSSFSSPEEDPEAVEVVLMTFDALRRRILQLDEINNVTRRPDMKAGATMADYDLRANKTKRVGPLLLVGLHSQSMAGIDSAVARFGGVAEAVAVSVVSSGAGGYEDQTDAVDSLVYCGQGGANLDQKLERGNLALERSFCRGTAVRVIRDSRTRRAPPIYLYDGLYRVSEYWADRGRTGFNVLKYRLLRQPDQPAAYATWKAAETWKRNPAARPAVRLPDLAAGAEPFPICVVNEGACVPGDGGCACARRNGGELPYSGGGVLVQRRAVVYECGGLCTCSVICRNRATQKGGRGWGLRSWDPVRCGAFVCEFVGDPVGELCKEEEEDDEYMFEGRSSEEGRRKWNYGPELLGRRRRRRRWRPRSWRWGAAAGAPAGHVLRRPAYPPMTELTYDYGMGGRKLKNCSCGSSNCRGFFNQA
ncbi:unnamed protein product [Spirodela intermedia]|uniref:Uncharacterized protein n=1 Tax=Spirodela intermedia TaxID=51605 RepID=A0A7I8J1H1_SPIIN|nr:unnamed protein product [Spirodela intermedia]CAA6663987.1 unnamed protein product [Spirodela intermedia]